MRVEGEASGVKREAPAFFVRDSRPPHTVTFYLLRLT
jgi:hypothetical protein